MAKRLSTTNTTKSTVYEHFASSSDGKHYVCQCIRKDDDGEKQCDAKISSFSGPGKNAPTRASNLKRHLQRFHPKVLEAVNEKDGNENIASTSGTKNVQKSTGEQSQIRKFFISDKVTITMTPEKFKHHIIEMVVKNSVPLSFSQPAFLGLNGEMAKKLVIEEAKCKKEELQKVLKGRFVFLKMDACTRHRVNYFAINVRFVDENNKTITRTLGLKDTQAHHTSDYLQKLVEGVLEDFEIKKEQILCVVTDNASNMLSTIEKMNVDEETSKQMLEEDSSASIGESLETEENADIFLDNFVEDALKLATIHHMRCAVHTLQLAIRDGLKDRHAATLISKLRQVTVAARAPKTDAILKRRAGKGANLDKTTRWGSTYLMVKRLLELKDFIEEMDNENLALTESQWTQTKELENLLSHPFTVTKRLQCDDLTPGKFFLEWKSLLYRLNKNGGLIAEGIASSMMKRESLLLENELLLAAIYVDPMSRLLLNSEQTATGKKALFDVAVRMKGLRPEIPSQDEVLLSNRGNSGSSSNKELDFDSFLDKMEVAKGKRRCISVREPVNVQIKKFQQEFYKALKEVEKYDRSSKLTVEEAILVYPENVSDVARIVTAMPPTQVSVERLFSGLKIIKSDLRASMKEDLAEAILFLRTLH
ncbi:AP-4 complex subunit mu-1 isoform X1 [Bufo gargarizans]|uniref:AP-4 complex subunit mu-1 isoform X1 n=1 Tax=Bufo gargarizans TaxID=30331 RepID=UPI001CF5D1EA|nr:AP-4 complex subunit mu-1 isoform X1 [Bufo gargarizans]